MELSSVDIRSAQMFTRKCQRQQEQEDRCKNTRAVRAHIKNVACRNKEMRLPAALDDWIEGSPTV